MKQTFTLLFLIVALTAGAQSTRFRAGNIFTVNNTPAAGFELEGDFNLGGPVSFGYGTHITDLDRGMVPVYASASVKIWKLEAFGNYGMNFAFKSDGRTYAAAGLRYMPFRDLYVGARWAQYVSRPDDKSPNITTQVLGVSVGVQL